MRRWLLPALAALLTVGLGTATSVAALDPSWVQYARPAQIIVFIGGPILFTITFFLNRPPKTPPPAFDRNAFANLRDTVTEVVRITGLDPGLEQEENWADELGSWKNTGMSLITMSIRKDEENGKIEIVNEEPARELLRLIIAVMRAMLQRGWKEELTELAPPAYTIAMKLQRWDDAALIAHALAHAYYDLGQIDNAKRWIDLMGKNKQTHPKPPEHTEIQLRFLEMKGLLARIDNQVEEEKKYFNQALAIATSLKSSATGTTQVRLSAMIGTIQMRLAELAESEDLDKAVDLYKEALSSTTDSEVQIRSYERLGYIAIASAQYDDAYNYHMQQLDASKKAGLLAESLALEGMGKALSKKKLLRQNYDSDNDYEDARKATLEVAYQKLRRALYLQEELSVDSPRTHRLRRDIIEIIDKVLPRIAS